MMAFVLLSVAALAEPLSAQSQSVTKSETVFGCEYFRTDREAADGWVHHVDVRIVERADRTWAVQDASETTAVATQFPARFGNAGRSFGLRWRDLKGHQRTAYIAYSDVTQPEGMQVFWFNFDRPSAWKTPGYLCQSMGDGQTGAGA